MGKYIILPNLKGYCPFFCTFRINCNIPVLTKKLLSLQDIVLAVDRKIIKASAVSDRSLPPRHGDVLHRKSIKLENAGGIMVQLLAILQKSIVYQIGFSILTKVSYLQIGHPNLNFVKLVQNVRLGQT